MVYPGFQALRPFLYSRLKMVFGDVRVIRPGEAFQARTIPSPGSPLGIRLEPETWGETYAVCCGYCDDTKHRLHICHRWGHHDEITQTRNWWLIRCLNEDCVSAHSRRLDLWRILEQDAGYLNDFGLQQCVKPGKAAVSVAPRMPGDCVPLDQLPYEHPAITYLHERRFDVAQVTRDYDLSWCRRTDRGFGPALNRIIIPVRQEGALVGWQARLIGDPPPRVGPKTKQNRVDKYWSMPGWRRSASLYGLDAARDSDWCILVEGPTDVWRLGPPAVAAFGKGVSVRQIQILAERFRTVFVMLDGDARSEVDRVTQRLGQHGLTVIKLILPGKTDPGILASDSVLAVCQKLLKIGA